MLYRVLFIFFFLQTFLAETADCQSGYSPPKLGSDRAWTAIILPDPQIYVKYERNQPILDLMTAWISENIDHLNIRFVLCTGDLVDDNTLFRADLKSKIKTSRQQWNAVSGSFAKLDGKVPYITATGNHDYGMIHKTDTRKTDFHKYFTFERNTRNQEALKEVFLNDEGIPTLENAAFEFVSPRGIKYLIICLEFAPRDSAIEWAKKIAEDSRYKEHKIGILTHYYLTSSGEHTHVNKWVLPESNMGKDIWQKLIEPSDHIRMIFGGHIGSPDNERAHLAFRQDRNKGGKNVAQMVFNAQGLGGGSDGNGGDGWLRILEFEEDENRIKVRVKTFSPLFAISPRTQHLAWRRADYDEFDFVLD